MVLTKSEILSKLAKKEIRFTPELDGFQLQPHSIDMRLGFEFHLPKTWELVDEGRKAIIIDPLAINVSNFNEIKLKPGQYFELLPKEYVIATTLEKIHLNCGDIMGVLYPRSSINRRGLAVDLSGIIDVRYHGFLMIPIMNNTSDQVIRIYPGERICSVIFQKLATSIDENEARMHGLNTAKYEGANGFLGSKTDKQDEIKLVKQGRIKELKKKYKIK